jgi:uncharacterized protein (DUF2235 family)
MSKHVCRRLILFLDGTWNTDEGDQPATNIVYMRERLFWGLNARLRRSVASKKGGTRNQDALEYENLPEDFRKKSVSGLVLDGYEYIVYYDWGVGSGPLFDRFTGGAMGAGLDRNIRQAYRFLTAQYRPGDQIFVFGFSRGAYTARSLCGYLQTIGLLRAEQCTEVNEERAWRYYRTEPGDRLAGEWSWFNAPGDGGEARVHDPRYTRVRVLGVFDTVGTLGIPHMGFRRLNRAKHGFHDTTVNSLVDIRLHALSIDDPRSAVAPTLWTKPKFKLTDPDKSPTEQVWFAGAHSDIGGGYVNWAAHDKGLSFVPLSWMIQRVNHHCAHVAPVAETVPDGVAVMPNPKAEIPFYTEDLLDGGQIKAGVRALGLGDQHKPWALLERGRIANHRVVNQLSPDAEAVSATGRVAFADPFCEMVHVSALERLRESVKMDKGTMLNALNAMIGRSKVSYRPLTLTRVIPYLAATYLRNPNVKSDWRDVVRPIVTWKEPHIVDWNGNPLKSDDDAEAQRALDLLPSPAALGVKKMPEEMIYILDPRFLPQARALHQDSGAQRRSGDEMRLTHSPAAGGR